MPALVAQVEAAEAMQIVLQQTTAAEDVVANRLIYHPYAGVGYVVDRTTFGQRQPISVHTMVDLRNGSPAICEAWPELAKGVDDCEILGPPPIIDAVTARRQSRHCVLRALLKRKFSLRQPALTETDYIAPLYKPNWVLDVRIRNEDRPVRILVDGLNGGYHTVVSPPKANRDCDRSVSEGSNK